MNPGKYAQLLREEEVLRREKFRFVPGQLDVHPEHFRKFGRDLEALRKKVRALKYEINSNQNKVNYS